MERVVHLSRTAEDQEIPISYIGLEHLIENKRCVGRPKDLDDLAYLRRARGS